MLALEKSKSSIVWPHGVDSESLWFFNSLWSLNFWQILQCGN